MKPNAAIEAYVAALEEELGHQGVGGGQEMRAKRKAYDEAMETIQATLKEVAHLAPRQEYDEISALVEKLL